MAVVAALLLSLLGLAALWGLLGRGLSLCLHLLERWTQSCRDAITRERRQAQGQRCCAELGLSDPCSLRWHPDQGGDPTAWLRRLRAYAALCQLNRDASARQLL